MNEIPTATRSTVWGPTDADELEALRREIERLRVLVSDEAPTLLATLIRHSPHGIIVCDAAGKLTLHNDAAERIWGGSATTTSMRDWSAYRAFHADGHAYGPDDWAMVRCLRLREVVPAEEVHIERFDGTHALILGSCAPILGPSGDVRGALSVFADITAFHELGAAERASRERTAKLQAVTAALSEARLPRDVAQVVAVQMAAVVGAKQSVLATAVPGRAELELLGDFERFAPEARGSLERAFATCEPGWLDSLACAPLVIERKKLGAIAFGFEVPRVFDEADRALVQDLATQTALALERARLYESEQNGRRRNEALARISGRFAEAGLDLGPLLSDVAHEVGAAIDACTAIGLSDANGDLRIRAVYHPSPDAREMQRRLADEHPVPLFTFTSRVAETGKSLVVPCVDLEELVERTPVEYRGFTQRFPITSYLCVPLRAHGRTIGTLSVGRTRAGETFTEEDRQNVEEMADRAAIAIENARLYEEGARARHRAEQLYRFAERAVRADQVEDVFEAALDAIGQALGSDRASILVADRGGVMRFQAWRNLSDAYRRAAEGHSPWAPDVVSPAPVLVPDVAKEPSLAALLPVLREENIVAMGFFPLVTGGCLIGRFMVYHPTPRVLEAYEVELAAAIANHLASVIDRFAALADLRETLRFNELCTGVLAHDLRNPLGAMMSAAQLLLQRQEGHGDPVTKPLSRILTSGDRMARMIGQLLDFTRIRVGGGIEIRPRETDLGDLCAQVLDEVELAHPEWKLERRARGSLQGSWDPDRLLQMLSNLVGNAGQHGTPGGAIRVTLDGTASDEVVAEVHNEGVIAERTLPTLFDPFGAARQPRDGARGLGLGLFIVRHLAIAHGGALDVTSTPEDGTTMRVRLPRSAAPVTPTSAARL